MFNVQNGTPCYICGNSIMASANEVGKVDAKGVSCWECFKEYQSPFALRDARLRSVSYSPPVPSKQTHQARECWTPHSYVGTARLIARGGIPRAAPLPPAEPSVLPNGPRYPAPLPPAHRHKRHASESVWEAVAGPEAKHERKDSDAGWEVAAEGWRIEARSPRRRL